MVEKKHIVFDLRLSYNGPLSIEDFYAEVEKWMEEKGLQKDLKRKSEDVMQKGKKIEWIIEAFKGLTSEVKHLVRLQADGFIETSLTSRWTQAPLFQFLRTLFDKYIWNVGHSGAEMHESIVYEDCYDLHKRLKAFFNLSKMKVS